MQRKKASLLLEKVLESYLKKMQTLKLVVHDDKFFIKCN